MARLGDTARMRVRINDVTVVDTHGITRTSPLEEQVMLTWYTAHNRIATGGAGTETGDGIEGPLNMFALVRSLFGVSDDDARWMSNRIRQVLKKVGAARNISPGGDGRSPVWWIANSLPDNIVAVAQWVAANPNAGNAPEQYKPSRNERRLTPHEAGEDREPAPVTTTATVTPAVERSDSVSITSAVENESHVTEIEVEGSVADVAQISDGRNKRQARDAQAIDEALVELVGLYGPVTGYELVEPVRRATGLERVPAVLVRRLSDLVEAGRIASRLETLPEQRIRVRVWGTRAGRQAHLFAPSAELLERERWAYLTPSGEPLTSDAAQDAPTTPEPVAEAPLAVQVRALAGVLEQFAASLDAGSGTSERIAELELTVEVLEAENARLIEKLERFKERFARLSEALKAE